MSRPPLLSSPREQAFHRASTEPDYFAWLDHIHAAAGCAQPIRLAGRIHTIDQTTGDVTASIATADVPDGVIYKPCGNRRASVCPSCSTIYRRDSYHLIRAGLAGGKGVPSAVAEHPAVFVTFTAPSFGPVHTRRTSNAGRPIPCRPRREPDLCPHGVDLRCDQLHVDDDTTLGTPLCLDCYDHSYQVVWNLQAGELWRRTRIALDRALAHIATERGIDPRRVRLSYGKVAEMQRRGVVHFHAIIRLDGIDPDDKDAIVQAPIDLDYHDLADAIEIAVGRTGFITPPHHLHPDGWLITWGDQLDIRPVRITGDQAITDEKVAGYLSKYATKSTEAAGHVSRQLTNETVDLYADPQGSHTERLIYACWNLGGYVPGLRLADQLDRPYARLRRWAHMLGFGGHFLTKSRRYSTTFRILRETRVLWQRAENGVKPDDRTTVVLAELRYVGSGWMSLGDQLLANSAATQARERHRIGRIEAGSPDTYVSANVPTVGEAASRRPQRADASTAEEEAA